MDIVSVQLATMYEVTREEFKSIDWGYQVKATMNLMTANVNATKLSIPCYIVAYNTKSRQFLRDPSIITIPQMISRLEKSDNNFEVKDWQFLKHYIVFIGIQNIGKTDCRITQETITYIDSTDQNREKTVLESSDLKTMNSNEISYSRFEMDIPMGWTVPAVKIELAYKTTKDQTYFTRALLTYDDIGGWKIIDN